MCYFIGFRLVYNLLGIDIDKEKSATIKETGHVHNNMTTGVKDQLLDQGI